MSNDTQSLDADSDEPELPASANGISVDVQVAECINYAAWQNSVPFLQSIEVTNHRSSPIDNLRLELSTSPPFARPKTWTMQRITAGETYKLGDCNVQIDPDYLKGLNEAERGIVRLRLLEQGRVTSEECVEIRVLAKDEWGGLPTMAELLAAFVTPNDPALPQLLKAASESLAAHGHSPSLDGYQSGDPSRAFMLVAAIWSAVAAKNLTYANPPSSFEKVGQKTRSISSILQDGLATCLDSSLLFAAAIEAVGLHPLIVMQEGHCFVGTWLVERTLNRLIETDCSEIRKALAARELVTFETTLVTHQPPAPFEFAVKRACKATDEYKEQDFLAAIDIQRARMAQIRPMASHWDRTTKEAASSGSGGLLPLPKAPRIDLLPADHAKEGPTTPAGRIDRWQRKLLDLSLRNRLLNFRETKQTVPILCPDIARLEDHLAKGEKLRLISLSEHNPIGDRDAEVHREKTQQDLNIEFARQALQRNELACPLTGNDLSGRLTNLYRTVRNDLAEGGSNTLYLAVGFLKWKQTSDDARILRAPLLLVPVKLLRRSAASPYQLAQHEDDVRFNATLIQLLKKDFACDISRFEAQLPEDDSGVDVPLVLDQMRAAVRDIPGFEVVDEVAISTFSFAKYLMWKDLVDRSGQLENNRVVRHLIQDPDKPYDSAAPGSIPRPTEIDTRYSPQEMIYPLPADSSQLAAVMAASEGHDFVLVGPPGTGKSQTIANIIAQCLGTGRTVLFVAEKTAALDVVYRRLREHGLGNCCLELHSNKAERLHFLEQLENSWKENRRPDKHDWVTISDRLKVRRDELNAYVASIHTVHSNGWTAYRAMGVSVANQGVFSPAPDWDHTIQHDANAYGSITQTIADLALTYQSCDPTHALPHVNVTEWSALWEANLLRHCEDLRSAAELMRQALTNLTSSIRLPTIDDCSARELGSLQRLSQVLLAASHEDITVLFHKKFGKLPKALRELQAAIQDFNEAKASACATYNLDRLDEIPVDEMDRSWREACASIWPLSWIRRRRVTRLLQSYTLEGTADPKADLAAIRTMREQQAAVASSPLAETTRHWQGTDTDIQCLEGCLTLAGEARDAILEVGQPRDATNVICKGLHSGLKDNTGDAPGLVIAREFVNQYDRFTAALRDFATLAKGAAAQEHSPSFISDAVAAVDEILAHRTHLKKWTAWCDVKSRAIALGLAPFVLALEKGEIIPEDLSERFEASYVRWWLPKVIDRSPELRAFQRFQHEDAIADFCRLDEMARTTASSVSKSAICHKLPKPEGVPRKSELGLLRHQMGLKRPSKSIREVISGMPDTFPKLAPCLLMSPLSIAQYLTADQAIFDVVIFDEASQITTWDAIGAIARGKQTIIVGDPKQLPPTNFFVRADDDGQDEELEDHERDLESILDEAKASGLPTLQLNWHYRSRHESLIAFSNWNYYGNKLVTFPAAETDDRGVSFQHLPNALYDRGKSRTNRSEAEAIVADAVSRMQATLKQPEDQRLTYGVITFNSQQQSLIQDLFDEALRQHPELEWFFSDERFEPTVVKNLENVQGDERDVMFFSITFGRDLSGKPLSANFGALNRDGGERRLNVAVTRARRSLIVYSSFPGDELPAHRTNARGVRDLKSFLEYAEKGPVAIAARTDGSEGGFESPLEEAISHALADRGWQVESQIGISGFRVDLGIIHPDKPGTYLAGVECDGATYHRSAAARDRDKIRQQVLENLGWTIFRVWSADWWYDRDSALDQLHESLTERLESDRSREVDAEPCEPDETAALDNTNTVEPPDFANEATTEAASSPSLVNTTATDVDSPRPQLFARETLERPDRCLYQTTDLPDVSHQQERFFDRDYSPTLRKMALEIIEQEAPIREDLLARRVARAHGYARTGSKIRERVLQLVQDIRATKESVGSFLWSSSGPQPQIPFRHAPSEEEKRSISEIAMPELVGLVDENRHLLNDEDPAVALARQLGLARLAKSARSRLETAISQTEDAIDVASDGTDC